MSRNLLGTILVGLMCLSTAQAQTTASRFRWQAGQTLTYRVEQTTAAWEVVGENKAETTTRLNLIKRWQVLAVDAAGVATLQLSLTGLRLETTAPGGKVLLFDSADPTKSDPHMREELSRFLGQALAVLRIDSLGRVVEVKESKHGPASRFESELPFVLTLPQEGLKSGSGWERAYRITLAPPHGTGEKYDAVQKYTCKIVNKGMAAIGVTTLLKTQPEAVADRVPLLQLQPEGEILFDTQSGLLRSAQLSIDKTLTGYQGEGSSYRFQSTYKEEYVANP